MVGGHALRLSLEHPGVSSVTVIGRRPVGARHEKLHEVLHADFSDCGPIADALVGCDVALYCIGAYTGAVPDAEFRRITVDYTAEFAARLHERSPEATFCFLSGQGADRTGKSHVAFARYKGMAENALLRTGFPRVHIFRPGYVYPVTPRREPNLGYRVFRFLYPILRSVSPDIGITSEALARAMLVVGLDATLAGDDPVLEHHDIKQLVGG